MSVMDVKLDSGTLEVMPEDQLREPIMESTAPSGAELAAIVIAVNEVWPRPNFEQEVATQAESAWKFANRRWATSVASRGRPRRPGSFG